MSGRPWRLSAKLLIASSIATVIGFSAVCVSVMLDTRRGEVELARQSLENLASGIDADINLNIELYDLSLRAVASNMVAPEIKDVPNTVRHLILFGHAATAKHFRRHPGACPTGANSMPRSTASGGAIRHKNPISLLMIDADHFKTYNDTFGHQAGDQMLVGIAICISDSIRRAGDCAARYGGEEFAVLLPGIAATQALNVAESIRRKVICWSDEAHPSTVSIGIASTTPLGATDWPQLVSAADKALYAAKAAGRNRSAIVNMPGLSLVA
jgi:diguanylate cyclase (GGDEF)-like protein